MDLAGQVAIVTGAAKPEGIGHAAALGLAREGADIVIADLYSDGFAALSAELEALGRCCSCVLTDIADQAQVQHMVQQAAEQFSRIDILINAVGGSWAITPEGLDEHPPRDRFVGLTNC